MNDEQYQTTQDLLITYAKNISQLDLDAFLNMISTCEAVGPILDPTAYRVGMTRLEKIKALAAAARRVQGVLKELQEEVRQTEERVTQYRSRVKRLVEEV